MSLSLEVGQDLGSSQCLMFVSNKDICVGPQVTRQTCHVISRHVSYGVAPFMRARSISWVLLVFYQYYFILFETLVGYLLFLIVTCYVHVVGYLLFFIVTCYVHEE